MKKYLLTLCSVIVALLSVPVMAATYYASLGVINTGSTYTMIPVIASVDNSALETLYYITPDGLDTAVTLYNTPLPHMVTEDKTLFAAQISGGVQVNYHYEMGNTPLLTSCHIITGVGGYITTADAAALEPGNNFDIEFSGYVDTAAGANKDIYFKDSALRLYVSGAGDVSGVITAPGSTSAFSSTSDGWIIASNASYANARNAASGTVWSAIDLFVGQENAAGVFNIMRSYLYFDTSAIPDGAVISAASIYIYGTTDNSTNDFDIQVWNGMPDYPHDPLAVGDYAQGNYAGTGGTFNTSGFATGSYNQIPLDATGIGWISKTGTTKLMLRSSRDVNQFQPGVGVAEYVIFESSDTAGTTQDPYITITYTDSRTVTASGVTSGEHTIILAADGTDLTIDVDGTEEDSVALSGITVPNNANNIIWLRNNVSPYADYLKYTIGGTLIAWYQPNTIISGTTLPDREGAAQNGTITWGANPGDVSVSVSALISSDEPYIPSGTIPIDSPVVPIGGIDMTGTPAIAASPFYPLFQAIKTATALDGSTGWSETLQGIVVAGMITVVFMLFAMKSGSMALVALCGGVGAGIGYAMKFYNDVWILYVFAFAALALLFMEKRQQW